MCASSSDYSEWNIDDKWSSQEWNSGETLAARTGRPVGGQQFTQWRWYGLWHRHRIEPFAGVTVILAKGEWSIAKDIGPLFKRCNARHRETLSLVNVYVFDSGSICIHVKGLLRHFALQKDREQSHVETNVGHIWEVDSRTIRWDFWSVSNQLGRFMVTIIFGQWWRSNQSLACKGLCIFGFCVMSWKGVGNPTSNTVWQEQLSWFKDSSHYRTLDTIDAEPMEWEWNISQGSPHCSSSAKSKSSWPKWATHHKSRDELFFMSMFNDLSWGYKDNETECIANSTLVSLSFFGPGSEVSGILLVWQTPRRLGQSRWIDDDQIQRKQTPSSPCNESKFPEECSKSNGGGKLSRHFCADGDTIETVFHTIISVYELIFGAVSDLCDEYSACQARTVRPVLAGRCDPLFEPSRLLMTTPTPSIEVLARNFIAKVQRASEKALTTGPSDQNLY